MSLVRLVNASFGYSDALPTLDTVNITFSSGWTGLVGPNGAGKSTLLRLIDGSLSPTSGAVRVGPLRVARCPQQVEEYTAAIEALAWSWDKRSRRLHGSLQLDPEALGRWSTLSPGERKRWQVGAALAENPDVLLLDEPTNHLDARVRAWLAESLRSFRGVGIVVSHDRWLLDTLTSTTVRIESGAAHALDLPYSEARRVWDQQLQERIDARHSAQDEARRRARQLEAARKELEAAQRQRSTRVRMRNRNDSDARGMLATVKANWAEARLGRTAAVLRRKSEGAAQRADIDIPTSVGGSIYARYERCPQPYLAAREAGSITRGEQVVLEAPALAWGRDQRIRLEGVNGAGKTTLVHALLDELRIPRDRLLVLPQDLSTAAIDDALRWLHELPRDERGRVLQVVAALGVEPSRLLRTSRPSPGEARKLMVARGLGESAWGLVLDEPTNHLDLPSIERLEAALEEYPGAILLVSHDDAFAEACTDERWRVTEGRVELGG